MSAEIIVAEHFRTLGLGAAAQEYRRLNEEVSTSSLSFDEKLAMILGAQVSIRLNRRIQRRIKEAEFKIHAQPQEIDYLHPRGVTTSEMAEVLSMGFIRQNRGIIISGPTGVGKTFLCCAIGMAAVQAEYSVRYFRLSSLFEEIAVARGDGSYKTYASKLRSRDLLIIDDFALAPIPSRGSRELLDLLDDRIGSSSTIIVSQVPMSSLHKSFEDATIADAVLDRIVHSSIRIEMKGESMRKILAKTQGN